MELLEYWAARMVARLWLWWVSLYRALWPIQVYHYWTDTGASLALQLPASMGRPSLRLMQVTDAHLSMDPLARWERRHAERMHGAFRSARSLWNHSEVSPVSVFRELLDMARESRVDVMALTGDIVSFPQEQTVRWVSETLNSSLRHSGAPAIAAIEASRIPYVYTAGNHDWFYEDSDPTQRELRHTWRQRGLAPLYLDSAAWGSKRESAGYGGFDFGVREMNGVLLVSIDNSIFQITRAQLAFFREQVLRWRPMVLLVHVPLSVHPRLRPFKGYALCGDPAWGAATDRSWTHERRQQWPESGNSRTTELFLEAVLAAAAPKGPLIAVLSGHVHAHDATPFGYGDDEDARLDEFGGAGHAWGATQYVTHAAFEGGFRVLDIQTLDSQEAVPREAVEFTLYLKQASWDLLEGLVSSLAEGGADGASFPQCLPKPSAGSVGLLDVRWVEAAVDDMLRRDAAAMRWGFKELARALRPALQPSAAGGCPGWWARTLGAGLEEMADPASFVYEPGERLELRPGVSVYEPLIQAVVELRTRGNWEGFGWHMGGVVMQAAACRRQGDVAPTPGIRRAS